MEQGDRSALLKALISMQVHLLTIIDDQREFNRQQLAQNASLEILVSELMGQSARAATPTRRPRCNCSATSAASAAGTSKLDRTLARCSRVRSTPVP